MTAINMLEAKTNLSRLVDAIERGAEREIVIARNGKPAARLVPMTDSPVEQRIGIARGLFEVPDDIALGDHDPDATTPQTGDGGRPTR